MFYDFNGSSFGPAQNNTAQNFFKPPDEPEDGQQAALSPASRMNYRAEGDRLPTRERGYRSANQNMRRRDMARRQQNIPINGADPKDIQQINESDNSMQTVPPQHQNNLNQDDIIHPNGL